jgi:hypothetical protein
MLTQKWLVRRAIRVPKGEFGAGRFTGGFNWSLAFRFPFNIDGLYAKLNSMGLLLLILFFAREGGLF